MSTTGNGISDTGQADPVKLRPSSYLVLGLLGLGARSGYAIKKLTDVSTKVFFPISLAQVYPELARLERGGFVTRRDDPHGGRRRASYDLTGSGREALLGWLRLERIPPTRSRDEGLLRLFLADALPQEDQRAYLARMRAHALAARRWMTDEVMPVAEVLERQGHRYPMIAARFGTDLYAFVADWLEREADSLQDG